MDSQQQIAQALLNIGAVGFNVEKPITFKSGIISPVYVDNRKLPFHPEEWNSVLQGFKDLIDKEKIDFDIVAGVEAAGIPHSAGLGFLLRVPSLFIRKQVKDHGTKKMVEGGEVLNKKVLLVEDLVSTGISSLTAVKSLRGEGAVVNDCLVIVSYEFEEAKDAFKKDNVKLHSLTSFPVILEEAVKLNTLNSEQVEKVKEWFVDPHGWAVKYGFK